MSDPLQSRFGREFPAGHVLFREGDVDGSGPDVTLDPARLLEFMEFLATPRKSES